MGSKRRIWLACGASIGLPLPASAQSVNSVHVVESNDSVSVHVVGDHLTRPEIVNKWEVDRCVTVEWSAGLLGKSQTIPVHQPDVASVWYGWFSSRPRKVRMQIRTKHPLTPTIKQTPDGWTVIVGAATPVATATSAPVTPKKKETTDFPETVPPLDAPKPVAKANDGVSSATLYAVKQTNDSSYPDTVPPVDATKTPATEPKPVIKPTVKKQVVEPPFPDSVPPLEVATMVQTPALAAALKQAGTKVTIVQHDPVATAPQFALQFDPPANTKEAPFPDRVPPLQMAVKHSAKPETQVKSTAMSEKLINLNCTDADLPQILKGLALQTGANILISPDVKGKVTASLHGVPVEQALRQLATLTGVKFESINGLYIFGMEPKEAKPATTVDGKPGDANERSLEKIVPIQSDAQEQIKSAIEARFKDAKLNVFSSTGDAKSATLPQGNGAAQGQSAGQNNAAPATPAISTVDAQILPARYIILIGPASVVVEAAELAKEMDSDISGAADRYDKVARSERELFAYDVKYSDPRALREAVISQIPGLRATIPPNSAGAWGVYDEGKQISQANQTVNTSGEAGQSGGASAASTSTGATSVSAVDDSSLEQPFSKEEKVSVPMRLLLRGTHDEIQQAVQYLAVMDIAPKQVALELRVMDLDKQDAINAGIDWNIITGGAVKVINLTNGQASPSNSIGGAITGKNFTGDVTASLDRIASNTNLIARPNLIAMDGRQTEIFVGDIVRYVQSITNSQNGVSITTGEVPVGVRLSVLARVGANGNMTLDLRPRVSILDSFTQVPGGGELPQTSTRMAQSTINVESGQTIAIGGLIQDQDIKNVSGIPFLMDLPFLGHLFKKTNLTRNRTELVFFLTVRTLDGPIGSDGTLPMQRDLSEKAKKGGKN